LHHNAGAHYTGHKAEETIAPLPAEPQAPHAPAEEPRQTGQRTTPPVGSYLTGSDPPAKEARARPPTKQPPTYTATEAHSQLGRAFQGEAGDNSTAEADLWIWVKQVRSHSAA
jgi:hypothetical protein